MAHSQSEMLELLSISFTFTSIAKLVLIIGANLFLGYTWYSPVGFQNQWMKAKQWKEDECEHDNFPIVMSVIGALLSSALLNIVLTAFNIGTHQFLSAVLVSAILCGFYAFNAWSHVFFTKKNEYKQHRTLYLIDIGFIFIFYTIASLILVSF
ncbi:unnamed protein product [Rotaria socialis]